MKVSNMTSSNGNTVPNQFIIENGSTTYFQSYDSIIVKIELGQVYLDATYYNYSKTTTKYRNLFLGMNTKEIMDNIKNGTFILTDLN